MGVKLFLMVLVANFIIFLKKHKYNAQYNFGAVTTRKKKIKKLFYILMDFNATFK